ncbi:Polyisoprenoid-binding protein YceI [Sanguibacter gelidistatuariae]|uniref:Polyisoprenoid-binding protein YceI n=1 Tax=Sanguibacter gelidistatuariae TaxID=1814289 RepID=A0A1G6KM38_9MICO|nr:YceI family protein [Sanguibacter gelidistatuariae]SDC32110.1 Polyisoprenoid-binding protein YceI [Sanguibacter gelidistatuariae]
MQKKWIIALAVVVVAIIAVVGGTALYARIENNKAPDELALSTPTATASADAASPAGPVTLDSLAGAWTISDGSQAGYRVAEVLNGQNVTVVGRTTDVTGSVTITGPELVAADVTVSMTSVATDNSSRDRQFLDILSTSEHPTSTFALTSPVDISAITGGVVTVDATGDLTIAGVTRSVTVALSAQTTADGVEVSGSIPVTFSDYGVDAPNLGFVKVEDAGTVEMLLQLGR